MTDLSTFAQTAPARLTDGTSLADVVETFELLEDWEDRYRYVIDLGRKLPTLPEAAYTDANKVRGCTSQVWLTAEANGDKLILRGDSDAHIVKGLVALMLLIFSDQAPRVIRETDAKAFLGDLGLAAHLSPMRANGLFSMVERIGQMADAPTAGA